MREYWTSDRMLKLIKLYKKNSLLWNVRDENYKNRARKDDAWKKIAEEMHCSLYEIMSKINNVRRQFRREHAKVLIGRRDGTECEPHWFGYKHLLFTLRNDRTTTALTSKITEGEGCNVEEYGQSSASDGTVLNMNIEEPLIIVNDHPPLQDIIDESEKEYANQYRNEHLESRAYENNFRDEFAVYGEYVANELRKMGDHHAIFTIQHIINNTLFEGHMGKYNKSEDQPNSYQNIYQNYQHSSNIKTEQYADSLKVKLTTPETTYIPQSSRPSTPSCLPPQTSYTHTQSTQTSPSQIPYHDSQHFSMFTNHCNY